MASIPARFFDGRSPKGKTVTIRIGDDDQLRLVPEANEAGSDEADPPRVPSEAIPLDEVKIEPPFGADTCLLRFADGGVCECPGGYYETLATRVPPPLRLRWLRHAESSLKTAALCFLASLGLLAAFFIWGIPYLADQAARRMSPEIERLIAREAMRTIDRTMLRPSTLAGETKDRIRGEFRGLVGRSQVDPPDYRILFRGSRIGPNAFALPAGKIIMTDELVELAENRAQIHGVLAHELGHVHHRHGLRAALQAAGHGIVITFFLGDVSSALSVASALPSVLIETGHSRRFEREADRFAAEFGVATGIGTKPLEEILEILTRGHGETAGWLSTHPPTSERVELLREVAESERSE